MRKFTEAVVKRGNIIPIGETKIDGYDVPLGWLILAVTEGRALVVSEKVLSFRKPYGNAQHDKAWESNYYTNFNYRWSESDICRYLNNNFVDEYKLDEVEILSVPHRTDGNSIVPTENTAEKVFLLSSGEADKYFRTGITRNAKALHGEACSWALRTPSTKGAFHISGVTEAGSVTEAAGAVSSPVGIRPAFWFKVSD